MTGIFYCSKLIQKNFHLPGKRQFETQLFFSLNMQHKECNRIQLLPSSVALFIFAMEISN